MTDPPSLGPAASFRHEAMLYSGPAGFVETAAPFVRDAVAGACERLGIRVHELPSGAGHDGMQLTELCPMGMIFVRSKAGVSHSPDEWSTKEDCAAGSNVLYWTVLNLADGG